MKTIRVLIPVLILLLAGCTKVKNDINEATEFDLTYSTEVAVPSTSISVTAPADFLTPEVVTDSEGKFAQNQTTKDRVRSVSLSKFTITADKGNLNYLKAVSVFIKAPGLSETLVATKETMPANASTV